jgi:hypothetical protein
MKIKILLTIAATLCLGFYSFGQSKSKMTPLEYNDYLSATTDSLYKYGSDWGNILTTAIQSEQHDYTQLKAPRTVITNFIIRKKKEINNKPAIGVGGEGMKQSMLSFLDYEYGMIEKSFIPFESISRNASDADIQKMIDKLTEDTKGEESVLKMVAAAQTAFAKQNGFEIEKETTEE